MKKIEPRIRQKTIPSWKIEEEDLKESHFPDSNLRHKKQAAAVPEPLYRLDQENDLSLDRIHRIKKIKEKIQTHRSTLATNLRDWRRRSDCRGNKNNFIKVCTFSLIFVLTKTPGRCIWKLQGGGPNASITTTYSTCLVKSCSASYFSSKHNHHLSTLTAVCIFQASAGSCLPGFLKSL